MMLCYIINLNRAEGSKPHMQRYIGNFNAFCSEFIQHVRGEMKPCSRRCCRSEFPAVNRLIPFPVLKLFLYVRRKRHRADFIQNGKNAAITGEFNKTVAVLFIDIHNFTDQPALSKGKLCADLCSFPRLAQAFPDVVFLLGNKQKFNQCTCILLHTVNSGGNYPGII